MIKSWAARIAAIVIVVVTIWGIWLAAPHGPVSPNPNPSPGATP